MTAKLFRFYFSFRSPYAWIAAERLEAELGRHARFAQLVPVYPTQQTFPNDPTRIPNKLRYIAKDIYRLTREYGLPLKQPESIDTDWVAAHAAFCGALRVRKGHAFMLEMFRARFGEGLDIGRSEVIAAAAVRCDLDPQKILEAAADEANRAYVGHTFRRGQDEDGIFGVPSFVFNGSLYWGHDRMAMLRRAMDRAADTTESHADEHTLATDQSV